MSLWMKKLREVRNGHVRIRDERVGDVWIYILYEHVKFVNISRYININYVMTNCLDMNLYLFESHPSIYGI